jgi:ribosomal protein L7/L12
MAADRQLLELQQRLALVESRLEQLFEHLDLKPGDGGEEDATQDPEIQDLLEKGYDAQAVKRFRELNGAGIAEAQSAIRDAQGTG